MAIGSSNPTINLMKLKGNDISVNAGIKDNGTQRVVISTDQTVIPISDNGGSLTVDGTVELGATSLAALETISISGTVPVSIATVPTHGVTGTFWQATQPVSLVSQPLPTGASTETTLSALNIKIPSNLTTKAAATAATTSDPSLVVSISPNNTVGVTGTVELGSASLAALENISVTVPGTVDLGTVSLTALESITVVQPTGTNMHTVVDSGTITNVQQLGGTAISMNSGTRDAGTQRVTIATNDSVPVTGTFWQATQPVSIASVPSHAVTLASTTITSIAAGDNNIGNVDIVTMPAITGTVTANIGTSGSLALNTTLTDGTQKVINRGGAKGTTVAADITSTNVDVNTQALDVSIKNTSIAVTDNGGSLTVDGSVSITGTPTVALDSASLTALETTSITGNVAVTGTFWQTTQPVSIASMPTTTVTGTVSVNALPTGTNAIGKLAANPNVVIGGIEHVPSVNNALTNVNTTAYAASLVAKATSGKIYNIIGYNSKAIGQFVQIHNSASLPIDGSVPVIMFYVGPMSNFSLDYGVYGKSFSTGITICNSSTGPTLTVGSADCWFTAEII